jgi:hypothetical protein
MGRLAILGSAVTALLLVGATANLGCSRREPPAHLAAPSTRTPASSVSAPTVPSPRASAMPSAQPAATSVLEGKAAGIKDLTLGDVYDVGPMAPVTATSEGVVMLTRDDRLLLAPRAAGSRPDKTSVAPFDAPAAAFSVLRRAPAVAGGRAYWISRGRLVRRALEDDAPLEVLDAEARDNTRVSAVELKHGAAVAFLGRADAEGTSHARLWLEGKPVLDLTPEGAGASSVALTRSGDHLLAVTIDGRSAMTPLHARAVRPEGTVATLGDDVVVWVGGPSQAWTEAFVGAEPGRAWAHVPIERDMTHFGLANVELGAEPHMDCDVAFFDYANGIDLAPVATATLCGHAHVAFARPTTSTPHSPQELVLVRSGTKEAQTLASARVFAAVSLTAVPGGALLAYVADGRSWARGIACK